LIEFGELSKVGGKEIVGRAVQMWRREKNESILLLEALVR